MLRLMVLFSLLVENINGVSTEFTAFEKSSYQLSVG
jgi:hypothetical protein